MLAFEELWCQNCGKSYMGQCDKHGSFHEVSDMPIPSKAVLTMPRELVLKNVKCGTERVPGVFAKRAITNRTQFGPVDCPPKFEEKEEPQMPATTRNFTERNHDPNKSNPLATNPNLSCIGDAEHAGIELVLAGLDASGGCTFLSTDASQHLQPLQQTTVSNILSTKEDLSAHIGPESGLDRPDHIGLLAQGMHYNTTAINSSLCDIKLELNNKNSQGQTSRAGIVTPLNTEGRSSNTLQNTNLEEGTDPTNDWTDMKFELKIFGEDGKGSKLELADENTCNWMMFVRPAKSYSEQNLIAYQYRGKIYYSSIKPIPINTELRVWYAGNYAKLLKKKLLPKVITATVEVEGAEGWKCSICRENFSEFEALENHTCSTRRFLGPRRRGRPRKGRPVKYIKPSKTWRARMEKMELKDAIGSGKRKRGRPPKIKEPIFEENLSDHASEGLGDNNIPPSPHSMSPASSGPIEDFDHVEDDNDLVTKICESEQNNYPVKNEDHEEQVVFKTETDQVSSTGMTTRFRKERRLPRRKISIMPKLKVHKRHRDPLPCPHCDQVFMTEPLYVIHVANHTGIKPYICEHPDCQKGFMSKFKLERHLLIHTSPRSHKCLYCDKSFNRKDHLKNHMTTHDPNKRRWICEQCGKEYAYHFSYRTHIAYHNAEDGKTLTCSICQKEHTNKESLLFHLKIHSGARSVKNCAEKMHQCYECGKRFYTKKDVRRHSITHTKLKDFLCQFCPQRFGRKDHLTRHLRTSHLGDSKEGKPRQRKKEEKFVLDDSLEGNALQLPLVVSGDNGIPIANVTSVLSPIHHNIGNNTYLVTPPQVNSARDIMSREIPLQTFHALYEGSNVQQTLSVNNVPLSNQIAAIHGSSANQIQQGHRYTQDPTVVRIPSTAQTIETVAVSNDYNQTVQAVPSGATTVYVTPTQQHLQQVQHIPHSTVLAKEAPNLQLEQVRTVEPRQNMTVTVTDFQTGRDPGGRPAGGAVDARQNPNSQTFSTLLGYMETMRFLENLPTNAQGHVIGQLETVAGQNNIVPVSTTVYTGNTDSAVHQHPTELQKRPMNPQQATYQPGT
ncbi:hypothetical protein ScPMuIL_005640 [Solemya velum]